MQKSLIPFYLVTTLGCLAGCVLILHAGAGLEHPAPVTTTPAADVNAWAGFLANLVIRWRCSCCSSSL